MVIFEKTIRRLSKYLNWIALAGIVVTMLLTSADVIGRYFGHPIRGTFDGVGLLSLIIVAFALAQTQILKGHISVDFLINKLGQTSRKFVLRAGYFISICLFALLAWGSISYSFSLNSVNEVSQTVKIPLWPFALIIGINIAVLCLVLILDLIKFQTKGNEL
jgi:TRAP-type C4-dicarboxylate transport system permease small subunit